MHFKTAHVIVTDGNPVANAKVATRQLAEDFASFPACQILFFAATNYDGPTLAAEMHAAFPEATTIGCTTAGEGVDDKLFNASVVAMAFSGDVFEYRETAVVTAVDQQIDREDLFLTTGEAMQYLGRRLGHDLIHTDYRQYVGFMLSDRISQFSESVVEKIGELTDVIFVGGIAGDDYHFTGQTIFYQGLVLRSAAILALWKPRNGFALLKTQAVDLTEHKMLITKADEEKRIIWEFDGTHAAARYAELLGIPQDSLDSLVFDANPLAVTADGEPYVRAIIQTVENKGLQMFSRIHGGTTQTITHAGDIVATTKRDLDAKVRAMGGYSAVLHINCSSRHTTMKNRGQEEAFGRLFSGKPALSFSSYGEIYVGVVAMTSTMILFK